MTKPTHAYFVGSLMDGATVALSHSWHGGASPGVIVVPYGSDPARDDPPPRLLLPREMRLGSCGHVYDLAGVDGGVATYAHREDRRF